MAENLILFQFPGIENVRCAFQGRLDGSVALKEDKSRLAAEAARQKLRERLAPLGLERWRECSQVHGDRILRETEAGGQEADGIMTSAAGEGLMIKTADCQPILFASRDGRRIMAIHAGWRGNRINFPGKAVRVFCQAYDLEPRDVFAVRGPSLGPGQAEFVNFDSEWGEEFEAWLDRSSMKMDLWKLTESQLAEAGVPKSQIYGVDICTAANDWLFFSYRRNQACGRQASLIWKAGKE